MRSMIWIRCFMAGAFAAALQFSWAWIDTGHMVVAAIAESRLTPAAKKKIEQLVKIGTDAKTDNFLTVSCYADDYKSDADRNWHFINLHFRSDGQPSQNKPEEQNVLWAIDKFTRVLEDPKASDDDKAQALRYIVHFVGDVHQPLHVVARDTDAFPKGDRGGNDFAITPIETWGDRPIKNLHALWDYGCGLFRPTMRPLSEGDAAKIRDLAASIEKEFPYDQLAELNAKLPKDWANESEVLAKIVVYNLPEKGVPSKDYLDKGQAVAKRRIALAGYRLADLLNQAFR